MSNDRVPVGSIFLGEYYTIRRRLFFDYLIAMSKCFLRIDGYKPDSDEYTSICVPALHRWKPEYKKKVLAKMYKLADWYKRNNIPVTMVTLTTHHNLPDGSPMPFEMQIDLLKESFQKLKKVMKNDLGNFSYLWVLEPHKSGYAHMHLLYFGFGLTDSVYLYNGKKYKCCKSDAIKPKDKQHSNSRKSNWRFYRRVIADGVLLSEGRKDRYLSLWNDTYDAGGYSGAIDFSESQNLEKAGAYIFKYLAKTLDFDELNNLKSGYSVLSANVWHMSKRDTDEKGVRFWGSSQDLTAAMQYKNPNVCDTIWFRVLIKSGDDGTYCPIWISPDVEDSPEYVEQFDDWYSSLPPPDDPPDEKV